MNFTLKSKRINLMVINPIVNLNKLAHIARSSINYCIFKYKNNQNNTQITCVIFLAIILAIIYIKININSMPNLTLTMSYFTFQSKNKTYVCHNNLSKIKFNVRFMKSGGGKIAKEVSKEISKTQKPLPLQNPSPNISLNKNHNSSSQQLNSSSSSDNNSSSSSNNNSKPSSEIGQPNFNHKAVNPVNPLQNSFYSRTEQFIEKNPIYIQRDYRLYRFIDPENIVYDQGSPDTCKPVPLHVISHGNIQDDQGNLIGVTTSSSKQKEGFVPVLLDDENYSGQKKKQYIALYSNHQRNADYEDLLEDPKGTEFLKKHEEKIDDEVKKSKVKLIRKVINKKNMVEEDGSPRKSLYDDTNDNNENDYKTK